KCWICCASTGASSLPMRSIATAPLPTRYSSAAAIMFWRSKPTGGPCSQPSPNSLRDRASAAPPSRSTSPLTTAAKRDARPSCVTPAWLQFIGFLVLQGGPDHLAETPAGPRRRAACRSPLSLVQIHVAKEAVAHHPQSLGHREPAPLGA